MASTLWSLATIDLTSSRLRIIAPEFDQWRQAARSRLANAAARQGGTAAPELIPTDDRGVNTRSSARNKRSITLAFPGLSDLIDSISPLANVTVIRLAYNIVTNSDRSIFNASPVVEVTISRIHVIWPEKTHPARREVRTP
jgi:hypothetical protein